MSSMPCLQCKYSNGKPLILVCSKTKSYCIAERAINHDNRPCGKDGKLWEQK